MPGMPARVRLDIELEGLKVGALRYIDEHLTDIEGIVRSELDKVSAEITESKLRAIIHEKVKEEFEFALTTRVRRVAEDAARALVERVTIGKVK